MPQTYNMGPMALLPLRRKACWGFFALKIRRLRPGLNPRTWVLKASTHFILYTIKIVYCQGDMFRPYWGIHRPSKKTDPRIVYISLYCGIPNAVKLKQLLDLFSWRTWGRPNKVETCRPDKYIILWYIEKPLCYWLSSGCKTSKLMFSQRVVESSPSTRIHISECWTVHRHRWGSTISRVNPIFAWRQEQLPCTV